MTVHARRAPMLALLILMLLAAARADRIFKITRVECLSVDKNFSSFDYCRLKAVKRNVAELSFKILLNQIVRDCWVNAELLRKYNGYKPFILNATIDACRFIKSTKKAGPISILYRVFGKYTNLNHTCPYEGAVIMEKFSPVHENLHLPLPSGEYLLLTSWTMQKQIRIKVNCWFTFEEK